MPIHKKVLSADDVAEVHAWLKEHNVNPLKIRRDFSDVYPVAELLRKYYPKSIELYNYPKKNSVNLKLINWQTFNTKVLSKLGIVITAEFMDMLANGEQGAIEVLLYEILKLQKKARQAAERAAEQRQEQVWAENDEVMTVLINKQIGDGIVQVPQKMILYSMYENILRESQAKETVIDACHSKIEHLERIIKVKSERIEELQMQMGKTPSIRTMTAPALNTDYDESFEDLGSGMSPSTQHGSVNYPILFQTSLTTDNSKVLN